MDEEAQFLSFCATDVIRWAYMTAPLCLSVTAVNEAAETHPNKMPW